MTPAFWTRYVVRSMQRSGRRVLFVVLCISVGVASVVALQTAALTVQSALTSNVRAANGGDVSVSTDATPMSRGDLQVFAGLQRQGRITNWTALYSLNATTVGANHILVPFEITVVPSAYPIGGQPTFVTPSGGNVNALLQHHGDVLLTTVLANELNVGVGSHLLVNSIGGHGLHAVVRGILAETSFEHSSVMTVNNRDAAVLTSRAPHYTAVYANVNGPPAAVAQALRARFPVAQVQTVQEALAANQQQVHDFQQFLLLVGLLALLIAGIGILNAMQSMLAWRRLESAMLKAIGFRQGTLYALFGGEALLLGLIGGIGGTVLGALASKIITNALARAMAIQVTFRLDIGTLLLGVALGIGSTLIFAILPIVRAAAFRPLEILREGAGAPVASGVLQTIALIALVVVLFGALAAGIMGDAVLAAQFVAISAITFAVLTGAFSVLVGLLGRLGPLRSRALGLLVLVALAALTVLAIFRQPSLAALLVLVTALWAATVLLPTARRLSLIIAVRSLSRRRARTSITLVAFLVGVLCMSITLTVALSLRGQINSALASEGSTNLVALTNPRDERSLLAAANRLPAVQHRAVVTVVQTTPIAINGQPLASIIGPSAGGDGEERRGRSLDGVTGIDLRRGDQPSGIRITQGRNLVAADAGTNHALLRGELTGFPFRLRLGDEVTLREAGTGQTRTVRAVGFFQRPRRTRGFGSFFVAPIYADRSIPVALGGSDAQTVVSFTIASAQLTHDATTLQRGAPGALVIDIGDLAAVVENILNELLNLLAVITALALGSGLAVVGNGVALAMLERRREMALFKAIGFGPGNVLRFVLVENALAGTLAGAVAVLALVVALGIISRVALQHAIGFDPVVAVLVLLGATLLAVLTAYLAARTAVKVRPLEALRNE